MPDRSRCLAFAFAQGGTRRGYSVCLTASAKAVGSSLRRDNARRFALGAMHLVEMVQRYVHLAQVDIEEAYRMASPVYNMDLRV